MEFIDIFDMQKKLFRAKGQKTKTVFYRTNFVADANSPTGRRENVSIRLTKDLLRKIGVRIGERLTVLQDQDNPLRVAVAKAENGPKLTPANWQRDFESYKAATGHFAEGKIMSTIYPETTRLPRTGGHTVRIRSEEVSVMELDGRKLVVFTLPRDSVELDRLAKEQRERLQNEPNKPNTK